MSQSPSSGEPAVLVSQRDRVTTIAINRPQKKNALDREVEQLLGEAIFAACRDESRVIVLSGTGGDFSSGADLTDAGSFRSIDITRHLREEINPIVLAMRTSNKPFIAKVRGACVGLGCNLALACDMIFASEDARFSQIFVRIGLEPDGGGSFFMPRAIGYAKAFEKIVTGAMIAADEAERIGLINRVCKAEELDGVVDALAAQLAGGAYLAVQQAKASLREGLVGTLESALEAEAVNQRTCFNSADFAEGLAAFREKRRPNFRGE